MCQCIFWPIWAHMTVNIVIKSEKKANNADSSSDSIEN